MSRMLSKWNPRKHEYEPYQIPDSWNVAIYCDDMEKVISCAECGEKIKFGDAFSSRFIHTELGFSYCICGGCMKKEIRELREVIEEEEACGSMK